MLLGPVACQVTIPRSQGPCRKPATGTVSSPCPICPVTASACPNPHLPPLGFICLEKGAPALDTAGWWLTQGQRLKLPEAYCVY